MIMLFLYFNIFVDIRMPNFHKKATKINLYTFSSQTSLHIQNYISIRNLKIYAAISKNIGSKIILNRF